MRCATSDLARVFCSGSRFRRASIARPRRVVVRLPAQGVLSQRVANGPTSALTTQQMRRTGEKCRSPAPFVACISLKRAVVPARRTNSGSVGGIWRKLRERTGYLSPRSSNLPEAWCTISTYGSSNTYCRMAACGSACDGKQNGYF